MATIERETTYTLACRNPYYGPHPDGLTNEITLKLAEQHVAHYSRLLVYAGAGIRLSEVLFLRRVWRTIQDFNGVWDDLTPTERGELVDAWADLNS